MNQSPDFFQKKAYEISYALMRLCSAMREPELRQRISSSAIRLVEYSVFASGSEVGQQDLKQTSIVLRQLVQFGEGIGDISYRNAEVILEEIGHLIRAIEEAEHMREEVRIEHLFSGQEVSEAKPRTHSAVLPNVLLPNKEKRENSNGNNNDNRQSAIIRQIADVKNCRMKDLVAAFPDISERTIRNEIGKMIADGEIQRIGPPRGVGFYVVTPERVSTQ